MLCLTNSLMKIVCSTQGKSNKIKVHTTLRAKCVYIASVKIWNGLRIALRNCTNIFTLNFFFLSEKCIKIRIVLAFGIFMH